MNEEIYEGTPAKEDVLIGTDSGYNRYRRPDGSTYIHYPYSLMATVTAYSAKDGKGLPIRTADGKLITGKTQAEADRNRFRYDMNHWVEANRRKATSLPQDWRSKYTLSEGKDILTMTPVAGDILDLGNVYSDFNRGNYGMAATGLGLFFLPNIVEKPLKWVGKPIIKRINNRRAAKAFDNIVSSEIKKKDWFNKNFPLYTYKPQPYNNKLGLPESDPNTFYHYMYYPSPININGEGVVKFSNFTVKPKYNGSNERIWWDKGYVPTGDVVLSSKSKYIDEHVLSHPEKYSPYRGYYEDSYYTSGEVPINEVNIYTKNPFTGYYDGPHNIITYNPSKLVEGKTSLKLLERPSKLTKSELAGIPKGERNLKVKLPTNWDPENWFSLRLNQLWDPEDARILASHVPEYREIERIARANKTFMKFPDGTPFNGDPREWIMMMSQNGTNVLNPLKNPDLIPAGVYRSGVRNLENAKAAHRFMSTLMGTDDAFNYNPLSNQIDVWNGTNRDVTKVFGKNNDLSYNPGDFNISDPIILKRLQDADNLQKQEAQYLSDLLGYEVDPHYLSNYNLEIYKGNAKELGLTEKQLTQAIKQLELYKIQYNNILYPDAGITYTSLYPIKGSKGKVYLSPDGKMRQWSEILLDDGTIKITDDAVQEAKNQGYDFTIIENVREGGMDKFKLNKSRNHDLIIHSGTPRVSFLGNNGNLTGIGGVYKKQGGKLIKKQYANT